MAKLTRILLLIAFLFPLLEVSAQNDNKDPALDIYGFAMTDVGYNFNQIDPSWFDVMRTTKLPAYANEFAPDGNVYFSVRQTRFGVKGYTPTKFGVLKTQFEFELFGTGVDAGQTTFRLRHAYGQLGKFLVGQTWSPFMDADVFPNSLEYWGPPGMVFFRNIQIRYMPLQGETFASIALERPGASADQGIYSNRIELQDVKGRFPVPDLSGEYHKAFSHGYVEAAGIIRYIKWEDQGMQQYDLSGNAIGWGINLSSNLKPGKNDVIRLQVVYGSGIENYMNDAPVDIGIKSDSGNVNAPIKGVTLPVLGLVAFIDHNWSDKFSTTAGWSMIDINNSDAQNPSDFHQGQYALANIIYYPTKNMMAGAEVQYGGRSNFSDGFTSSAVKVQFSFKYNFSKTFYHEPSAP